MWRPAQTTGHPPRKQVGRRNLLDASVVSPLLLPLAQTMSSVIAVEPYADLHSAFDLMSTAASGRMSGRFPADDNVPHPVIQHFAPTCGETEGKQAVFTHSLRSKGLSSLSNSRSLLTLDGRLYCGCRFHSTTRRICPSLVLDLL